MSITASFRSPGLALALTLAAALLGALLTPTARAATSIVNVPVSVEYPLLRHLLARQLFNTPDGSREIINDPKACNQIVLSEPGIGAAGDDVEITAKVAAELGVDIFGTCLDLIHWQGGVAFLGRPMVQPGARSIKLEPQKSWLIARDGGKIFSGPALGCGQCQPDVILRQFRAGSHTPA